MAKGYGHPALPSLILFPLPLQIEFVTGTKKGTTTNATATTTTTASTAVAGRLQSCPASLPPAIHTEPVSPWLVWATDNTWI